ncbi:hypothetical protein AKJ16_DCAP14191 [Drosera capensis]
MLTASTTTPILALYSSTICAAIRGTRPPTANAAAEAPAAFVETDLQAGANHKYEKSEKNTHMEIRVLVFNLDQSWPLVWSLA